MGAALTSHALVDLQHQQLLSEYIDHSRKTAEECAHIFRGSLSMYDNEQTTSSHKGTYPRYIHLAQFEEVFGMLVADPEPHFRFFYRGKIVADPMKLKADATVCAYRVFCAVALLMKADLHSKVDFVLRLYADVAGDLTPEAKRLLLSDFVASVEEVLQVKESIPGSVLTTIEKALQSDEPGKLMTVLELYEVCLTNPQISGMLHSVHALIEEFSTLQRQEKLRQRENNAQAQQTSSCHGTNSSYALSKSMVQFTSTAFPRASLLWDLKAGDYDNFWSQPQMLQLRARESCVDALEKMARVDTPSILIVDATAHDTSRQLLGFISIDKLLLYFVHLLAPGYASDTTKVVYEHTRARAEDAIQQFGATPLRDVIRFYFREQTPLVGIIRDDEAFFNIVLRFACGESSVAVAQNYAAVPKAVLGRLTVFDMLAWLDENMTLLNGKERCALAAFPQFFYAPAKLDVVAASASVCEGLVKMASRGLSGILVETSANHEVKKLLSANAFGALFPASFAALSEKNGNGQGPLLGAMTANASVLSPACIVYPSTSIAKVIQEMIDKQTRRVVIQRQDGLAVGVVRASDIMQLLLCAQHKSMR